MSGYRMSGILVVFLLGLAARLAAAGSFEEGRDSIYEVGVRELWIEVSALDVDVRGGLSAVVEGRGKNLPGNLMLRYRREGSVLRVWVEKRFPLLPTRRTGTLLFHVPRDVALNITSASGTIEVHGTDTGSIHVEVSSGDIGLSKIRGDVSAKSASGSVELTDVTGDTVVSSSSGGIELDTLEGKVRVSTSSGGIRGNRVYITGDSEFKTSSGSVDVDFANPLRDFRFRLSGSSGRLRVGEKSGEKTLVTGSGPITVTGVSSSGSQYYH